MRIGFVCKIAVLIASFFSLILLPVRADTPAEKRYISVITPEMRQIGSTIIRFSYLLHHPQVGQRQWSDEMAVCCVQMRMYPAEVQKIAVPKRYRTAHRHLTAALQGYSYIGYHLPGALDRQDGEEGNVCAEKVGRADEELHRYQQALKAAGVKD